MLVRFNDDKRNEGKGALLKKTTKSRSKLLAPAVVILCLRKAATQPPFLFLPKDYIRHFANRRSKYGASARDARKRPLLTLAWV